MLHQIRLPFITVLLLLFTAAITPTPTSHPDATCAEDDRTCADDGDKVVAAIEPPPPVFKVSQSQKVAVTKLYQRFDALQNFSSPNSDYTAGGLFTVDSDEKRRS